MNEPEDNLQALLSKALKNHHQVQSRLETPTADKNVHRVVNSHRSRMNMLFGSFVLYEEGTNKTLVILDLAEEELPVEYMAPPKTDGKRREFLDSVAYFGVMDDHVILLQSSALRADDFENHLIWLLQDASVLDVGNRLALDEYIPKPTQSKIRKSHVKSVSIGAPLESRPLGNLNQSASQTKRIKYEPTGVAANVLQQLLPKNWFKDRNLKSALDDSRLQVTVELKYSYQTSDDGQGLLDDIATELRNINKDEVEVELRGGGSIKGDELHVFRKLNVKTLNGIIDETDLYPKMHDYLKELIDTKIIDP